MARLAAISAVAAVLVGLCLAGCATDNAHPAPRPTVDVLSDADRARITQKELDDVWATSGLPDSQRPVGIEMVRYVTLDDWAEVIAACMTEEGAPTAAEDGGLMMKTTAETAPVFAMARYVCQSRYPTDPVMLTPLNQSQLRYLYAYYAGSYRDCLREHGAEMPELPSEQTFVDNYRGQSWDPLRGIPDVLLAEVMAACPQRPEGVFG